MVFPEQSKALHARAQLQDLALQHVVCIRNALPGFERGQHVGHSLLRNRIMF